MPPLPSHAPAETKAASPASLRVEYSSPYRHSTRTALKVFSAKLASPSTAGARRSAATEEHAAGDRARCWALLPQAKAYRPSKACAAVVIIWACGSAPALACSRAKDKGASLRSTSVVVTFSWHDVCDLYYDMGLTGINKRVQHSQHSFRQLPLMLAKGLMSI